MDNLEIKNRLGKLTKLQLQKMLGGDWSRVTKRDMVRVLYNRLVIKNRDEKIDNLLGDME